MSTNLIGKRIDGYEIIRILGRGGMGVVYKAHEMTLQRVVALKVLPTHLAENKEFITRFYREARAAAQLNHPNVVTIHRVGSDDGYHYIAMEYLKGRELTEVIKEKKFLDVPTALEITRQVAGALAAAHELKILHRDIKPQNIMLDDTGRVKVMDFGIAKIANPEGDTHALTMTGQLIGTPAYMSPEQCKGAPSDHRSDIYSLGVVLYQMLTGRVPYTGETPLAVIRKIVEDPVPAVYGFNQEVPDAAVKILHKALAKDPEQRYASASDLESDIRKFLAAQGVKADVSTEMPTIIKMTAPSATTEAVATRAMQVPELKRKSKIPVIFLAGSVVLALAVVGGVTFLKKKNQAGTEEKGTKENGPAAVAMQTPAEKQIAQLAPGAAAVPAIQTPATSTLPAPTPAPPEATPVPPTPVPPTPTPRPNQKPVPDLALSSAKIYSDETITFSFSATDPDEDALELAYRIDGKNWFNVAQNNLTQSGFAAGEHQIELRARDTHNDEAIVKKTFFVNPRPTATKAPMIPTLPPAPAPAPKTKPVIAANPELKSLKGHGNNVMCVAFSPDGGKVISGGMDKSAIVWDVTGGKQLFAISGHTDYILSAAFSPDGKFILTGSQDHTARLWDAATGAEVHRFERHPEAVISVAFTPDGKYALTASNDGAVSMWETATTSEIKQFQMGKVNCVAFSADGRQALSGSADRDVKLWDVPNGTQTSVLKGHTRAVLAVAFSHDAKLAASGGQDKRIILWDVAGAREIRRMEKEGDMEVVHAVAFSPDGRTLISGGKDQLVRVWDAETGSQIDAFRNHTGSVLTVAFSPDSHKAVSGSSDQLVRVWGLGE